MWGNSILVAPKLDQHDEGVPIPVTAYLPDNEVWYNAITKLAETEKVITQDVASLQQAVWFRGGFIIPELMHQNELSLLRALDNSIGLGIYPDSDGNAHGSLYLDDGWSTSNKSC